MWKIFNPFKRRSEVPANETSNGKENEDRVNVRGPNVETESCDEKYLGGSSNLCNQNGNNFDSCGPRTVNGHTSLGQSDNKFIHQDGGRSPGSGGCQNIRGGSSFVTSSHDRLGTSPAASRADRTDIPLLASSYYKSQNTNQSFCGVYGPLLSTPIVPKVRRALETSAGLRSPPTSALTNGRKVGRSASLNYGSGNPARPTAGMVPWVRLKNKESIPLSDIISGKLPRSPNTVKLGPPPEPRHLPMAPGFKSTPLIVTTEPSRARVVDTQTVVSALREKRKRLEIGQFEDPFNEDPWINAAKRRRQDSSQSNASSVSIPSMPESLPNLMGTPGVSLLHIENLKDQRPSTVPAMDAFVSHRQRQYGLGGELVGRNLQREYGLDGELVGRILQREEQDVRSQTSSRTVLRSIQSSLSSSSLGSRTGLFPQQQRSGMDMNQNSDSTGGCDVTRQASQSSDICMMDQSDGEPPAKQPKEAVAATTLLDTTGSVERAVPASSQRTSHRTLAERKIAEGVVLRKHNFSFSSPGHSARLAQAHPMNSMITSADIERDRQKEYRRRMMELLGDDEEMDNTASAAAQSAQQPAASAVFHTAAAAAASSAATSAAVSASLDSLNKLVQSTGAMLPPVSSTGNVAAVVTTSSLGQVLQASDGKLPPSANTTAFTLGKDTSLGFHNTTTTPLNSANVPATVAATSSVSAGGGFNLGAPTSTESAGPVQVGAVAGEFQLNFPRSSSSSSSAASAPPPAVSPANGQPSFSSGFALGGNAASGFSTNSNAAVECSSVTGASALPSYGTVDSRSKIVNPVIPSSNQGVASVFSPAQSGSAQEARTSQGSTSQLEPSLTSPSSGPLLLSSSGQAFSSVPQAQASFSNALSSVVQSHGFLSATMHSSSSSSLPSTSSTAASIFSLSSSSTMPAMLSGFSSQTASLEKPAPPSSGFSLGASSTTTSTAGLSQQAGGGFHFGVPSTGSLTPAPASGPAQPSTAWTTHTSAGSLHDQSTSSAFKGFGPTATSTSGAQFQNVHPPIAPATATVPQIFSSGSAAFGTSSSTPQQPFGNSSQVLQTPFWNPPQGSQPSLRNTSQNPQQPFGNSAQIPQPSFGNTSQNPQPSSGNTSQNPQQSFGNISQIPQASFGNTSQNSQQPFGNTVQNSQTPFGNSSQTPQQPFGVSSQQPFGTIPVTATSFSQFNTAATTAATTNSGLFAFGQTPATTASSQSFTFGAFPTQLSSVSHFGGGTVVTTSASPFGNTTSLTSSASAPSIFGSGSTSAFTPSVSNATTVFGSASTPSAFGTAKNPATAFGAAPNAGGPSSSLFTMPSASSASQLFNFGASSGAGTQAAQPTSAFGAALGSGAQATQPTSAFGAALGAGAQATQPTSAFGASMGAGTQATQPASVFGASMGAGTQAIQPASAFGASMGAGTQATQPVSVFGASMGAGTQGSQPASVFGVSMGAGPQATQPASVFGANPTPSFGSSASAPGSSMFAAAKPPAFGGTTVTTPSVFGSAMINPSTQAASTFGSNFGSSNPFGGGQATDKPSFGTASTAFGATNTSVFAAPAQGSLFGPGTQNPGTNIFGSASQNPAPAFGSQQGQTQASNSNPFASSLSGKADAFGGVKPNTFGSATPSQGGFNFPVAQPSSFGPQASSGFNFVQPGAQPAALSANNTGFNFAGQTPARPTFQTPSSTGFNFAAAAAGASPSFNFSGAMSNQNPFSPVTPNAPPRPRVAARRPVRKNIVQRR